MKLIAFGNLQFGVIMLVLAIPLVLRKVPMNQSYGIRIRAAFESEQRWYDINAYGGKSLAAGSLLIIAAGVIGFFISSTHFELYAYCSLANALLAVGIPIVLTLIWSRNHK